MADRNKRICSNAVPPFMRLPVELQTEIFLRLPITSLSRCKRVCKSFRTLIRSPDFQHNHNNTSHSLLLQFKPRIPDDIDDYTPIVLDHPSHVLVSVDNTTKGVISNTCLVPQIPYVGVLFLIGSCNGLVCFAVRTKNGCQDDVLLLWNPVTEQSKYIPVPKIDGYDYHQTMEVYFVPETNDYNILSIGVTENRDDMHVAVYRVSTNSWEIVDHIRLSDNHNEYFYNYRKREWGTSVFLNGSFHWIFSSWKSWEIVSFNVKDEKLGQIRRVRHDRINEIGIIDESLALLNRSDRKDIEIEVMNDYGVEDSWVLKYTLGPNNVWLQGCWNNSVMTADRHSVYLYDTNDGKMMKKLISLPENYILSGFTSFSLPWLQ